MADTSFTLPGGQKIPKKTLLIGGAVLVVVLVVLMRRGQSAEPGEEGQFGAQGDLGEGEGAGGFGGASDADLGSILAALSQMNQAPSQIYSPAPASVPTLTGGGVQWSAGMLSDPSQEGFEEEEVTGLRGIDVFGPEGRPRIGQSTVQSDLSLSGAQVQAEAARFNLATGRQTFRAEPTRSAAGSAAQRVRTASATASSQVGRWAGVAAGARPKVISGSGKAQPQSQVDRWRAVSQPVPAKTVKAVIRRSSVVARSPVQRV